MINPRKLLDGYHGEFIHVPLVFEREKFTDVFTGKNNKSLGETLKHKRYIKLCSEAERQFGKRLNEPLGLFLKSLKDSGDDFYKKFLNRYGDLEYSIFRISNSESLNLKGIYVYFLGDEWNGPYFIDTLMPQNEVVQIVLGSHHRGDYAYAYDYKTLRYSQRYQLVLNLVFYRCVF